MGFIEGLDILEISEPKNKFTAQVMKGLAQDLVGKGVKGIIASGIKIQTTAPAIDLMVIVETGIAVIACCNSRGSIVGFITGIKVKGQGDENFPPGHLNEQINFLKERLHAAFEPIFVHGILVCPDATSLDGLDGFVVNRIPNGEDQSVIICNESFLPDIVLHLGNSCTASLCAFVKDQILDSKLSQSEMDLLCSQPIGFGKQAELQWTQKPPDKTAWMYEGEENSKEISGAVAVADPPEEEIEEEVEEVPETPIAEKSWISYLSWAGLVSVFGISFYIALTPVKIEKNRAPTTEEVLTERTEEFLSTLDRGEMLPGNIVTKRLRDELINEYALGKRALWEPQTLSKITERTAVKQDSSEIQVKFKLSTLNQGTHNLFSIWQKKDKKWMLDDWKITTDSQLATEQKEEFPGTKLRCRRDNRLFTRNRGLYDLYDLPPFKGQIKLSENTFRGMFNNIVNNFADSASSNVYFSSILQKEIINGSILTNIPRVKDSVILFGPSVWPGKPVFWFSIRQPNNNTPVTGIAAFSIESGQVVINEIKMTCPSY
jgi:hypothetical protein